MARVFVIGGGPAGSVFAARMAGFGHAVTLAERLPFPRDRLGESLTPGVPELLRSVGAEAALSRAGARQVRSVTLDWDAPVFEKDMSAAGGLIVDRGRFDAGLAAHALAAGVCIRQPAQVTRVTRNGATWRVSLQENGRSSDISADYVAWAGGRRSAGTGTRRATGVKTIALWAYWDTGSDRPGPALRARRDGWYWGVPLPCGRYNTLAFVDPVTLRKHPVQDPQRRFDALIEASGLLESLPGAIRTQPFQATDATPGLETIPIGPGMIRIGDAALSLDPVSSSGVQKSLQGAVAGAVCANTQLRKPKDAALAEQFYREMLTRTSDRHAAWTDEYYAGARVRWAGQFWLDRSGKVPKTETLSHPAGVKQLTTGTLALCERINVAQTGVINGAFVENRDAVMHPEFDGPVTWLSGIELAPLIRRFPKNKNAVEIARTWSDHLPEQTGIAILAWLLNMKGAVHVP